MKLQGNCEPEMKKRRRKGEGKEQKGRKRIGKKVAGRKIK
jgi:hypothetical protein